MNTFLILANKHSPCEASQVCPRDKLSMSDQMAVKFGFQRRVMSTYLEDQTRWLGQAWVSSRGRDRDRGEVHEARARRNLYEGSREDHRVSAQVHLRTVASLLKEERKLGDSTPQCREVSEERMG